jgi:hypothetical protein
VAADVESTHEPVSLPQLPKWVNAWGMAALFLAGLALLCGQFSVSRYLTINLSTLALLVALLGVLASVGQRKLKDTLWLCSGGAVGLALLAVALVQPAWLNPRWEIDFSVPALDNNKQFLVTLDNRTVKRELSPGEWVNPKQDSIRMGDVHVRIQNARISAPPDDGTAKVKEKQMLVSFLVANTSHVRTILYEGQGTKKHPPILQDNQGNHYGLLDSGRLKRVEQIGHTALRPATHVEDIVVFEAPPDKIEYLEVELPASAWKSTGKCVFRIPRHMISKPMKPAVR